MKKEKILKKIDSLYGYTEKIEYLNSMFLKAKNSNEENMILEMIKQLQFFGK